MAANLELPLAKLCDLSLAVDRVERPSRADFSKDYLTPQRPVVLRGAMAGWGAPERWQAAYLKKNVGEKTIRVSRAHRGVHFLGEGERIMDYVPMRFADYIDSVESGRAVEDGLYASVVPLVRALPELLSDIEFPEYFARKDCPSPNLWFGPGKNVSPLHYDSTHNLLAQVRGTKTVLLAAPSQLDRLYPHPTPSHSLHISRINVMHPDEGRFPDCRKAQAAVVTLEPGDMLFIPLFWWHAVIGHDINLSINFWWRTPVSHYARYPRHVARGAYGLGANVVSKAVQGMRGRASQPKPA